MGQSHNLMSEFSHVQLVAYRNPNSLKTVPRLQIPLFSFPKLQGALLGVVCMICENLCCCCFPLQSNPVDTCAVLPELVTKSTQCDSDAMLQNGLGLSSAAYQYSIPNGDVWKMHPALNNDASQALPYDTPIIPDSHQIWGGYKERSHQTLSELKRQRAAAKLLNHPFISTHFGSNVSGTTENGGEAKEHLISPRTPTYASNGTSVYYTVSSGDPPLLKFKAPMEEMEEKVHGCCRIS